MKPEETGSHYDQIALSWQKRHIDSKSGIAALERAIRFVENKSSALDIGCGSSGRFIEVIIQHGFIPTGLDISAEMIALARQRLLLVQHRPVSGLGRQHRLLEASRRRR